MSLPTPLFQSRPSDRPLILGIDPGISGAMALYCLDTQKIIEIVSMPSKKVTMSNGAIKRKIVASEVALFVDINRDLIRGCVIEDVTAMPGNGVVSMFNFGFSTGLLHGILVSNFVPIITVKPTVWKSSYGLTSDKKLSIQKAKVFFPEFEHRFMKNSSDGLAEAALLAKYGEKIFGDQVKKGLI